MSDCKTISIEITSLNAITTKNVDYVSGWGEDADAIVLTGEVAEIEINKDGKLLFGVHIRPDGSLILTNYDYAWQLPSQRHVHLENLHPWDKEESK